jgi:hypothetical protein
VSLEVKHLGSGQYEITCGDQTLHVAGFVGEVTAKSKTTQASAEPAGAIYPYFTIPVGPISQGKSRFSVMVPALPGLREEDLGEFVLHLQEHPTWRRMQSNIEVMTKPAPVMIFQGLGKKIP